MGEMPPPLCEPGSYLMPPPISPHRYFKAVVEPTVREALAGPRNIRKAIVAAVMLYHLPEHALAVRHTTKRALKEAVEAYRDATDNTAGFTMLRKVAFAAKHGRVDSADGYILDKIWYAPPAVLGRMVLGRSFLGDTTGGVVAAVHADPASPMVKVHKALETAMARYLADFPELASDPAE